MSKTPLNQEPKLQLPARETILTLSLEGKASVLSRADLKESIEYILQMLTEKQILELSKKMMRCKDFIKMTEKGMTYKAARSVIRRRYNIHDSNINITCEPCQEWIERNATK
jgi:hypothetical protein